MPVYDASLYDPPVSVADVTLRDTNSGILQPNIKLLIDTGVHISVRSNALASNP